MDNLSNQQIIEQMYRNYATGNMSAVLSCFDKDIVWERPGAPFIPFAGIFKGIEEVTKMFAIQATTLSIKKFLPEKICTNEDTVVVLGHDKADVSSNRKNLFNTMGPGVHFERWKNYTRAGFAGYKDCGRCICFLNRNKDE